MRLRDQAPAKLNLALEITGLTAEGYHSLRSVMISLELADELVIEGSGPLTARPRVRLRVLGGDDDIPTDSRNLVVRAIEAFAEAAPGGWPAELRVDLRKRVPSQAGMGGGSADAGAVLRMLASVKPMGADRLHALGALLGSDVPFMIDGGAALAEGRGERLTPLRAPGAWWVVLVQPEERISTAWCYRRWDELTGGVGAEAARGRVDAVARAVEAADLAGVVENLYNDLQGPVFDLHPHLQDVPRLLREAGCLGALMTGSGSVFFGLCATRAQAREAARTAQARGLGRVWVTRTQREAT